MSVLKQTLLLLCFAVSIHAQTYRIHDGGMARTFIVEEFPAARLASPAKEPQIVLYEAGARKTEYSKRIATQQVLVKIKEGADPAALAKKHSAILADSPTYAPGFHILETTSAIGALALAETLRNDPSVLSAEPLLARKRQKKSIPNDLKFSEQWHLLNTGQNSGTAGIDIRVSNVWNTYQGSNIVIGIVDDGLLATHEDLSNNVNTALGKDWVDGDNDPSPKPAHEDTHGTPCAGVSAARGNNGVGVSGSAPRATLVGLRLISNERSVTDADEAGAFAHSNALIHIKSNSWGPDDNGETMEGPGTLAAAALKTGAESGTLFFWAGGNGYDAGDDANYDGYANSIYTIAIAAVSDEGFSADYGEPGACLVVSAPSDSDGRQGITTTSSDGNYENDFGGTSSATPLAAGVGALMLEANPNLGWRDVQEILMKTAWQSDVNTYAEWQTNSAGLHFDHFYGAGLIDAEAAVDLSEIWTNLGAHTNIAQSLTSLDQAIPDDDPNGVANVFSVSENFRVEHVTLTTEITHTYRSDVEIWLTSPNGMESLLAWRYDDPAMNLNWTFSTVRNWGENSAGNWIVQILDNGPGDTGTLNALTLTLYGTYDADSDLIDDTWEIENFGSITHADLTTDTDFDGSRDYDEWRAGTQPTNAASTFAIETLSPEKELGWSSISGKSYTVECSTNLLSGFQPLETNLIATPPQNVFTNLPAGSPAFYRILLETD